MRSSLIFLLLICLSCGSEAGKRKPTYTRYQIDQSDVHLNLKREDPDLDQFELNGANFNEFLSKLKVLEFEEPAESEGSPASFSGNGTERTYEPTALPNLLNDVQEPPLKRRKIEYDIVHTYYKNKPVNYFFMLDCSLKENTAEICAAILKRFSQEKCEKIVLTLKEITSNTITKTGEGEGEGEGEVVVEIEDDFVSANMSLFRCVLPKNMDQIECYLHTPLLCSVENCGQLFISPSLLTSHKTQKHGEGGTECEIKGGSFTDPSNVLQEKYETLIEGTKGFYIESHLSSGIAVASGSVNYSNLVKGETIPPLNQGKCVEHNKLSNRTIKLRKIDFLTHENLNLSLSMSSEIIKHTINSYVLSLKEPDGAEEASITARLKYSKDMHASIVHGLDGLDPDDSPELRFFEKVIQLTKKQPPLSLPCKLTSLFDILEYGVDDISDLYCVHRDLIPDCYVYKAGILEEDRPYNYIMFGDKHAPMVLAYIYTYSPVYDGDSDDGGDESVYGYGQAENLLQLIYNKIKINIHDDSSVNEQYDHLFSMCFEAYINTIKNFLKLKP